MFVKVVLAIPIKSAYFYAVPENLANDVKIGKRVEVNFNNRITHGYIIEITEKLPASSNHIEIKPVLSVIDIFPVFNQPLFALAKWISDYYYASLGEVLKLMTPSAEKAKEYKFARYSDLQQKIILTPEQQKIYNDLIKLTLPGYALIYGVTSSGKTEIYLNLIEYFIKKKSRLFILSLKYH